MPRAGKTTIAGALERTLLERGKRCLVLDGESLRRGVSSDLGFSSADRVEHMRRTAEIARLLCDQGLIVIVATVSPTAAIRERARGIVGADRFLEVFCDAPLAVCESRDADRLFARAREGSIANVSGIDHPFEAPVAPDARLDTVRNDVASNVAQVIARIEARGFAAR